ncbi:MAG: DEAD/DEAH box helicase family protein [Parabacteroides sp.]|nr:DEAD/DEAH box helicase family protein [Parabacteroides sp.]
MIKIIYKPTDHRYIFLYPTDEKGIKDLKQLEGYLNKIPQYMFLPSFSGIPKPVVFLNKFKTTDGKLVYWTYSGLWKTVIDYLITSNISFQSELDDKFKYTEDLNIPKLNEFQEYVNNWNLNITPRDYQIKAAWLILHYKMSLSQLATRAGKTLIAYIVFRYLLEHGCKNILMIVPSIQLVKQGVEDMKEYQEFFQTETIWAKGEMCESSNLTIGTYQSLVMRADRKNKKFNPKWFNKFDIVMVDECHHLVCKSIGTIMGLDWMKNVKVRFGFTGTLPEEGTIDSFACHSLMGPTIQDLSPMELVESGVLAKPNIKQIHIKYNEEELINDYIECGEYLNSNYAMENGKKVLLPKESRDFTIQHQKTLPFAIKQTKKLLKPHEYMMYLIDLCKAKGSNLLMLEQMLLHRSKKRVNVIDNLLMNLKKNVIVFCHHTEYIRYLAKHFKEKFPDRNVLQIEGTTNLKKRQKVINKMLENDNCILVASYGCCSTGITFKNVDYGVFAQSFKSEIIVKQSIGRLMLKTSEKDEFYLYDLVDCFPTKKLQQQGKAKLKTYQKEGFDCEIIEALIK